jgi:signal transduction histidine kinase
MGWPIAKRSLGIYVVLIGCGLGVCAWQWGEHRRFEQAARQALINRGRDITSTLGIVVSSQRRFGNLVAKDRIESALQGLIHAGELESIAIVGATGETIASAGPPVDLTSEMMRGDGVYWHERGLTLMNLMDLGTGVSASEDSSFPAALVVSSARMNKAFRTATNRPASGGRPESRSANAPSDTTGSGPATNAGTPSQRFPYSRPAWMDKEEYDALIKKQGVHSLVIALSTDELRRAVRSDLLLRALVSLLASAAAVVSAFAWRNVSRNSELQIRLVKAGEMNSHLSQMNFAAAGLAHETRNPLNLIRGLAQMISMQAQDAPKLKEHASTILEEADRVTVQLNEFIDYSKPREAHFAPVDVSRLVADVARTLLPDIEDKHIRLQLPTSPLTVDADEQLFRQALFNLLLNAVQAVAPGGQIEIAWSATGPAEVALEIRDDGPGVPEADRTNIFKPYVTMRPKGVGLGLAIVQQIVAAHRWEIACHANEPKGAIFRLTHLRIVPARNEA